MCFHGESNLPLEIPFLQCCLAYKSFSMTYLETFFDDRYHLQFSRFVNCSAPELHFSTCFFLELATKQQDGFKPYSGSRGKLSLWSVPLPDWKLEWHVPVQTPRPCVSLVPSLPLHPSDKFQTVRNRMLKVLTFPSGEIVRKKAGGVNPNTRR